MLFTMCKFHSVFYQIYRYISRYLPHPCSGEIDDQHEQWDTDV